MQPGIIRNREFATQLRDFSGLQFGTITPTDIDALIEYKNSCFIFVEAKHQDALLPMGQSLALQRLIDNLKKPSILFVVTHNTDGDIDFASTTVQLYYQNGKWHDRLNGTSLRKAIEMYIKKYGVANG